jgi:hypothetical protein
MAYDREATMKNQNRPIVNADGFYDTVSINKGAWFGLRTGTGLSRA